MMQRIEDRRQRYLVTRDEGGGTRDVHRPSSIVFRNLGIIAVSFCLVLLPRVSWAASPTARDISVKVIKDTQNSTLNSLKLQASDADAGDVLTYTVLSQPAHGQLKDEADQSITVYPYVLALNKLKYIPASGYLGQDSFTYKASDVSFDSNTATVSLNIVEWFPPIGIPEPEFGIKETYRMYDDPAKRNPALTYTQNAEGGYYTHYVDNINPNATDSGNAYGTVSTPRMTVPTTLPEGSVVEVHGGPYTTALTSVLWDALGSSARPIFVRGIREAGLPIFSLPLRVRGSYLILENLDFNNGFLTLFSGWAEDFMSIRHSRFHDRTNNVGISLCTCRDIVVFDNDIYNNGDWQGDFDGYNAISVLAGTVGATERIWIVDNHLHHNGEDGVQSRGGTTQYVYIGRNEIDHNRENALDIKWGTDHVYSQNVMHSFWYTTTSAGDAVRINDEGTVLRLWAIYNEIYDCAHGIGDYQSTGSGLYYLGNVIHDLHPDIDTQGRHVQSVGIFRNTNAVIVNNTIYNVDIGLEESTAPIVNNIVSQAVVVHLSYGAGNLVSNNLLWQNGAPVTVIGIAPVLNGITANPLFQDPNHGDFHLQAASPAIDAGISSGLAQEAFDTFQTLYGIDIRKDIEGWPRTGAWDIGAYEYVPSSGAVLYGDVSGDSEISAYDAALTAQVAVGLISLSAEQTQKADVNADAEVSAYDAALIAQYSVGIIDHFPVEG